VYTNGDEEDSNEKLQEGPNPKPKPKLKVKKRGQEQNQRDIIRQTKN
jgi:hypothetical protein